MEAAAGRNAWRAARGIGKTERESWRSFSKGGGAEVTTTNVSKGSGGGPAARRSRWSRALGAIDELLGIDALRCPVPEYANTLSWALGGVTAVSLGVLLATGILLAQFYSPSPESANESVRQISQEVFAGRFIRGIHYWAAQAMILTAILHLIRVFFTGSHKRPREANWLVGVGMLGMAVLAIFTGTVLKWGQEGYGSLEHNVAAGRLLGTAGAWSTPEYADQVPILVRLYSAHVVLIPGIIFAMLALHVMLVKKHRISPHPLVRTDSAGTNAPESEPSAPRYWASSACSP